MNQVQYTHGSIFDARERVIAHGCNAQGVMASGVAAAVASRWPEVKRQYQNYVTHYGSGPHLLGQVAGLVLVDEHRPTEHVVANVITQERYGRNPECRYVSYDAVDDGMRRVAKRAVAWAGEHPTVAIPQIGAGLGNGDWGVIESILERIVKDTGCQFNVYVPEGVTYRSLIHGLRS